MNSEEHESYCPRLCFKELPATSKIHKSSDETSDGVDQKRKNKVMRRKGKIKKIKSNLNESTDSLDVSRKDISKKRIKRKVHRSSIECCDREACRKSTHTITEIGTPPAHGKQVHSEVPLKQDFGVHRPRGREEVSEVGPRGEKDDSEVVPHKLKSDFEITPRGKKEDSEIVPRRKEDDSKIVFRGKKEDSKFGPHGKKDESEIEPPEMKGDSEVVPRRKKDDSKGAFRGKKEDSQVGHRGKKDESEVVPRGKKDDSKGVFRGKKEDSKVGSRGKKDDSKVVPHEIKGDSEVVPHEIKGDSEVVLHEIKGDSEIMSRGKKNESEVVPPEMKGDSEVVPRGKKDDSKGVFRGKKEDSQVGHRGKKDESEVVPRGKKEDSKGVFRGEKEDSKVGSRGKKDDSKVVPHEIKGDSEVVPHEIKGDSEIMSRGKKNESEVVPPEMKGDSEVVPRGKKDDSKGVFRGKKEDSQIGHRGKKDESEVVPRGKKEDSKGVFRGEKEDSKVGPGGKKDDSEVVPLEVKGDSEVVPHEIKGDSEIMPRGKKYGSEDVPHEMKGGSEVVRRGKKDDSKGVPRGKKEYSKVGHRGKKKYDSKAVPRGEKDPDVVHRGKKDDSEVVPHGMKGDYEVLPHGKKQDTDAAVTHGKKSDFEVPMSKKEAIRLMTKELEDMKQRFKSEEDLQESISRLERSLSALAVPSDKETKPAETPKHRQMESRHKSASPPRVKAKVPKRLIKSETDVWGEAEDKTLKPRASERGRKRDMDGKLTDYPEEKKVPKKAKAGKSVPPATTTSEPKLGKKARKERKQVEEPSRRKKKEEHKPLDKHKTKFKERTQERERTSSDESLFDPKKGFDIPLKSALRSTSQFSDRSDRSSFLDSRDSSFLEDTRYYDPRGPDPKAFRGVEPTVKTKGKKKKTSGESDPSSSAERKSDDATDGNQWEKGDNETNLVKVAAKRGKATMITKTVYTRILASLVPDEIIYFVQETKYRKYDVCLLFGDASGFTDLCERYSKAGKGGPSRLTVVLNNFIGTMVQEIMTHGGDVLKFSGDAFLAWWRTSENLPDLQDCVTAAVETAMIIQKSFGKYETDVQVTLRVKLAISAGQVGFSSIGTEDTKHYVVLGNPVWDVKIAEYLCVAGDIMVTPKAWSMVNAQEYDYEVMPDGQHVKVLGAGAGWRQMQGYDSGADATDMGPDEDWEPEQTRLESFLFMASDEDAPEMDAESISSGNEEPLEEVPNGRGRGGKGGEGLTKDETLSLRPSVAYAVRRKMQDVLRPYVIKPVLKGLDMDEPIEYLTEMRQVVIVFTNLVTLNPPMKKMIKVVDECYRIVCSSVHAHQGCVNKVSLFDKDMMFLIIFGLRGFKHELESQIALRCGAELHERLSTVDMVRVTSVGITTGMTYCGVVGHTLRREYSVIGPTVNKAARIMVAYPGKVTCDRETFLHSRLESSNFILQEHKELKGLSQAGPIYEFREHLMPKKTHILSKFPLLSRDDEMGLFLVLCDEAKSRYRPLRSSRRVSSAHKVVPDGVWSVEGQLSKNPSSHTNLDSSAIRLTVSDKMRKRSSDSWRKATRYFISGLVIRAEPRMGKSRLLDEMIHSARSPDVKIARVALTPKDFQMTLFGINRILEPILNFPDNATYKEKEEKLLVFLRNVPRSKWKYLYTLNELFQTTIDFSRTHPSERYPDPLKGMKRALWVLLSQVVKSYWIIGIDDLEFLDNASWILLPVLLEKDFAFFVMALGNRLDLAPSSEEILRKNKHLYPMTLGGIDKWYQVGLACQILDVWAIPPELERLIHERSGGNPGWVESYLVTQMQQGVLKIVSMSQDDADAMGLVRPPARMITRAAARRARKAIDPTRLHPTDDRWEMFKSCYHESKTKVNKPSTALDPFAHMWQESSTAPDLPLTQNIRLRLLQFAGNFGEKKKRGDKMIAVCILTPGLELLGQADDDFTINSMMLKVFDSLTSYEQMLLKCGAVLGETFLRKMLIALMSDPDPRQLALCVQKLFEMQVLTCASSDFGATRSTVVSGTTSFSSHGDTAGVGVVSCQCPALEVDEACRDLPDYASCSYMRFRVPTFRDTVYSLLTDSQKKEYHERAMRYLEQETRRCAACGRRHFLLLLGTRYERYVGRRFRRRKHGEEKRDRSASAGSGSTSGSLTMSTSISQESQSSRLSLSMRQHSTSDDDAGMRSFLQQITYEDMLLAKIRQTWGDPDDVPQSGVVERNKAAGRYLPTGFPWTFFGIFKGKGRVPSAAGLSLTRSFSSFNFTDCECTLILTSVYTQILGHCRGAELDEKTMDALLEYAQVCVYISNHAQAQRLLFEARTLLAEAKTEPQFGIKKVEDTREGSYIPSWKWPYLMGRIHTLLGNSRLMMGQYEEAHFQLHLAMAHMGVPFPENRFILRMVTTVSNMRLSLTTSFMARAWLGLRSGFAATYSDAIAECLSYLYVVFRDMGDWPSARLAATWGINRSLESGFDFLGVCTSFANMLEVLQYYGEFVSCAKLEVGAMEVCRNRASYLEIQELVGVGRLYRIIFHSLMTRGRIESSISVGYKTLRIASAVHATEHRLDVLPGLISCLIARNRVSEAVTLLNELEFIAEEDVDKTGVTWYYALAMEIHLHTGYSVLPYVRCEEFFKREGEAMYTGRNPQSSHRLYAALWLWCVRLEDWEGAKLWEHLARPEFTVPDLLSVRQYAVTTALIMQGLCILMAHLMDIEDTKGVSESVQKIEKFCKLFNKACSYIRYAEPHFKSIKAYFTYLKSNNKKRQRRKALRELRNASDIATRQGNARLAEWCKHNEKMWRGLLAPIKAETWRECAEPDNLVDWHEADKTPPRIMHYTLPLPDCLD